MRTIRRSKMWSLLWLFLLTPFVAFADPEKPGEVQVMTMPNTAGELYVWWPKAKEGADIVSYRVYRENTNTGGTSQLVVGAAEFNEVFIDILPSEMGQTHKLKVHSIDSNAVESTEWTEVTFTPHPATHDRNVMVKVLEKYFTHKEGKGDFNGWGMDMGKNDHISTMRSLLQALEGESYTYDASKFGLATQPTYGGSNDTPSWHTSVYEDGQWVHYDFHPTYVPPISDNGWSSPAIQPQGGWTALPPCATSDAHTELSEAAGRVELWSARTSNDIIASATGVNRLRAIFEGAETPDQWETKVDICGDPGDATMDLTLGTYAMVSSASNWIYEESDWCGWLGYVYYKVWAPTHTCGVNSHIWETKTWYANIEANITWASSPAWTRIVWSNVGEVTQGATNQYLFGNVAYPTTWPNPRDMPGARDYGWESEARYTQTESERFSRNKAYVELKERTGESLGVYFTGKNGNDDIRKTLPSSPELDDGFVRKEFVGSIGQSIKIRAFELVKFPAYEGDPVNNTYDFGEQFSDTNNNGQWDDGEPFVNENAIFVSIPVWLGCSSPDAEISNSNWARAVHLPPGAFGLTQQEDDCPTFVGRDYGEYTVTSSEGQSVKIRIVPREYVLFRDMDDDLQASKEEMGNQETGVLILAGFGYEKEPELGERVAITIGHPTPHTDFRITWDNTKVQIFDAPVDGTLLTETNLDISSTEEAVSEIYLQFYSDEEISFDLEVKDELGSYQHYQTFKVTRLSNGLGAPDGIAAHKEVIPGHGFVNLMNGNFYWGGVVRAYRTPLIGPDFSISYNHLDGIVTNLGRGWRSNYDIRLFDTTVDRDSNGALTRDDRQIGDKMGMIDGTGRRFVFNLNADASYHSEEKTGLIGAKVEVIDAKVQAALTGAVTQIELLFNTDPYELPGTGTLVLRNAGNDTEEVPYTAVARDATDLKKRTFIVNKTLDHSYALDDVCTVKGLGYKLLLNDNRIRFFNERGRLTKIRNLQGQTIDVTIGVDSYPVTASDNNTPQRSQSLSINRTSPGSGLLGPWTFTYEAQPADTTELWLDRVTKVEITDSNFTHTVPADNKLDWEIHYKYDDDPETDDELRVVRVTMPDVEELNDQGTMETKTYELTIANQLMGGLQSAASMVDVTGPHPSYSENLSIYCESDALADITTPAISKDYTVDQTKRRITRSQIDDYIVTYDYDTRGRLESSEETGGVTITYEYTDTIDSKAVEGAWLLKKKSVPNPTGSGTADTLFDYYGLADTTDLPTKTTGLVKQITDPMDRVTEFEYKENTGLLWKTTDPMNSVWEVTSWNTYGHPKVTASPVAETGRPAYTTTDVYSSTGFLTSTTNRWGKTTTYISDSRERLIQTVTPGLTTANAPKVTLDALGRAVSQTGFRGETTTITRDSWGRPTLTACTPGTADTGVNSTTALKNIVTTYEAKDSGYEIISSFADSTRRISKKQTDLSGRLSDQFFLRHKVKVGSSVIDVQECTQSYTYNAKGAVHRIYDAFVGSEDTFVENTYTSSGVPWKVIDQESSQFERKTTSSTGMLEYVEDADGMKTSYTYYADGQVHTVTNPTGGTTATLYHPDGKVASVETTADGETYKNTVYSDYYQDGSPMQVMDSFGNIRLYSYDWANGKRITDLLVKTSSGHDASGQRIIEELDAFGNFAVRTVEETLGGTTESHTTTTVYRGDGSASHATTPRGKITRNLRDGYGRVVETQEDVKVANDKYHINKTSYDAYGNVLTTTNHLGLVTTHTYHEQTNELISTHDELHGSLPFWRLKEQTARGQISKYEAQYEQTGVTHTVEWQKEYYPSGRLATQRNPDGSIIDRHYTSAGHIQFASDQQDVVTHGYAGREHTAGSAFTDYDVLNEYDAFGKKVRYTDPGVIRTWDYADGTKQLVKVHRLEKRGKVFAQEPINEESYRYHPSGLLHAQAYHTDQDEFQALFYSYDGLDRRNAMAVGLLRKTTAKPNFDSMVEADLTRELKRTVTEFSRGQVDTFTDNFGGEVKVHYNVSGAPTGRDLERNSVAQGSSTVTYTVDTGTKTSTQTRSFNGSPVIKEYDARGRLSKTTMGTETVVYVYNNANQLEKRVVNGQIASTHTYYNNTTKLKSISDGTTEVTYTYDDYGRIDTETLHTAGSDKTLTRDYEYKMTCSVGSRKNLEQFTETVTDLNTQASTSGTTQYHHNSKGRIYKIVGPDFTRTIDRDEADYILKEEHVAANGSWVRWFEYYDDGRIKTVEGFGPSEYTPNAALATSTETVNTFDKLLPPTHMKAFAGSWSVRAGQLHGKNKSGESQSWLSFVSGAMKSHVKITADPDESIIVANKHLSSGVSLTIEGEGRYQALFKAFRAADGTLMCKLELTWLPVTGDPVSLAESGAINYDGSARVLSLSNTTGKLTWSASPEGTIVPELILDSSTQHVLTSSTLGIETSTDAGAAATVSFDDLSVQEYETGDGSSFPYYKISNTYDGDQLASRNVQLGLPPEEGEAETTVIYPSYTNDHRVASMLITADDGTKYMSKFNYDALGRVETVYLHNPDTDQLIEEHDFTYHSDTHMRATATKSGTTDSYLYGGDGVCVRQGDSNYVQAGRYPLWQIKNTDRHYFVYGAHSDELAKRIGNHQRQADQLMKINGQQNKRMNEALAAGDREEAEGYREVAENTTNAWSEQDRIVKTFQHRAANLLRDGSSVTGMRKADTLEWAGCYGYVKGDWKRFEIQGTGPLVSQYSSFAYEGRLMDNKTRFYPMASGLRLNESLRAGWPLAANYSPFVNPYSAPFNARPHRWRQERPEMGLMLHYGQRVLDEGMHHVFLETVGMVPFLMVGEIADLANSALYAAEGIWHRDSEYFKKAGVSLLYAAPLFGDLGKVAKTAKHLRLAKTLQFMGVTAHLGMAAYQGHQAYMQGRQGNDGIATVHGGFALLQLVGAGRMARPSFLKTVAPGRAISKGQRMSAGTRLQKDEIAYIKEVFEELGGDSTKLRFNYGRQTGYVDDLDVFHIRGDILPIEGAAHPRSAMSIRATLAHELGHQAHRGTGLSIGAWNDEFRASYWAAKNLSLPDADKVHLIQDAISRAQEAGVVIKNNKFMNQVLYGF